MDNDDYNEIQEEIIEIANETNNVDPEIEKSKNFSKSINIRMNISACSIIIGIITFCMVGLAILTVFCTGSNCDETYFVERRFFPPISAIVSFIFVIFNYLTIKDAKKEKDNLGFRGVFIILSFIPFIMTFGLLFLMFLMFGRSFLNLFH